jgi:hypothetical protein
MQIQFQMTQNDIESSCDDSESPASEIDDHVPCAVRKLIVMMAREKIRGYASGEREGARLL